jgi:hypothetical protein
MTQTVAVADPVLFREFPFNIGLRLMAPGNIRPTAQQREAYRRFTQIGDPLADDLVEAFRRLPTGVGRQQFETAVEHGIGAVDNPLKSSWRSSRKRMRVQTGSIRTSSTWRHA